MSREVRAADARIQALKLAQEFLHRFGLKGPDEVLAEAVLGPSRISQPVVEPVTAGGKFRRVSRRPRRRCAARRR